MELNMAIYVLFLKRSDIIDENGDVRKHQINSDL